MRLANNPEFYLIFSLCDSNGKLVYEVSGMFGDELTVEELQYWICFNIIERAKFLDVDYQALPLTVVQELIVEEERKRNAKTKKLKKKSSLES